MQVRWPTTIHYANITSNKLNPAQAQMEKHACVVMFEHVYNKESVTEK